MLLSFCAGSKVKVILQHPDAASIVKHAGTILQKCWETQGNASFNVDISLLHEISMKTHRANLDTQNTTKQIAIPADIMDMLVAGEIIGWDMKIKGYSHCCLSAIQFTTHKVSQTNCYIFFKYGGVVCPGRIEMIFGMTSADRREKCFAAVCRNLPTPEGTEDPFCAYPDFSASLWSDNYADDFHIIPLLLREIFHAISMLWVDRILVIKSLNRVSNHNCILI